LRCPEIPRAPPAPSAMRLACARPLRALRGHGAGTDPPPPAPAPPARCPPVRPAAAGIAHDRARDRPLWRRVALLRPDPARPLVSRSAPRSAVAARTRALAPMDSSHTAGAQRADRDIPIQCMLYDGGRLRATSTCAGSQPGGTLNDPVRPAIALA